MTHRLAQGQENVPATIRISIGASIPFRHVIFCHRSSSRPQRRLQAEFARVLADPNIVSKGPAPLGAFPHGGCSSSGFQRVSINWPQSAGWATGQSLYFNAPGSGPYRLPVECPAADELALTAFVRILACNVQR